MPVLLLLAAGVLLSPRAAADIPTQPVLSHAARSVVSNQWMRSRADRVLEPLDAHPFATEFYLHQFASENDRQDSRWRLHLNPILRSFSKRIAGWPHALVRIMP